MSLFVYSSRYPSIFFSSSSAILLIVSAVKCSGSANTFSTIPISFKSAAVRRITFAACAAFVLSFHKMLAKKLNITVGSLTTAVNSLVKKGYVDRFRSKEDRRVVYVRLLEKGENAYHHHEDYHKQMTQAIVDKLDESEIPVLLKTLDALTGFFTDYTRESKEKSSDIFVNLFIQSKADIETDCHRRTCHR